MSSPRKSDPRSLAERQSIQRAFAEQDAIRREAEIKQILSSESAFEEWLGNLNAYIKTLYTKIAGLETEVNTKDFWRRIAFGSLFLNALLFILLLVK